MYKLLRRVEVWTKRSFLMDSGYYAGRGPSEGDLNSVMLEAIYQGVKKEVDDVAASNFVRFVDNLVDLSASSFIVALERFFASNCTDVKVEQGKADRTRITHQAQGFALLAMAISGNQPSEGEIRRRSADIKQPFISRHRSELM